MKTRILILAALLTAVTQSRKDDTPGSNTGNEIISILKNLPLQVQVFDVPKKEHFLKDSDQLQEPSSGEQKTFYSHYQKKPKKRPEIGDDLDVEDAKNKARVVEKARIMDKRINDDRIISSRYKNGFTIDKSVFHMDPVMNELRLKRRRLSGRRAESSDYSSSRELKDWKQEWNELWMAKKLEALNTSSPQGDMLNMVAARPWGVPCGDPNQHDMPWGTCMLAAECDSEYRIYRGDFFCGRTHFICCSLQTNTYDLYQGFDISFEDSSKSTEEHDVDSKERKRKHKERQKKRRKKARKARKKKVKTQIKNIVKEIQRILNKAYRNASSVRRKKTRTLKRYVKYLKKKYKKDRNIVKNVHELQMIKVDAELLKRIELVRDVNQNFMSNNTFRDIVLSGMMSDSAARMLVEAYPELAPYIKADATRRSGPRKDYLDYDIEYGPWGVPCGDPNQHDMPWGTCTSPAECDAEYRIYRGDYFCGRSRLVCCVLISNAFDTNQGFDVSFEDSNVRETDENADKVDLKQKELKLKRRRKRMREKRKKKIRKKIQDIISEFGKLLKTAQRNISLLKKKKSWKFKNYIKHLKQKFKEDREHVKEVHDYKTYKVDEELLKKLQQYREVNKNFMTNDTFRQILLSHMISPTGVRMLVEAYPDLGPHMGNLRTRRTGSGPGKDYLDYDIEYGLLFS